MFDPTAYENIKVVLEGAIYDLDLNGEIVIDKRDDIVNLATMSRSYSILFHLNQKNYQSKTSLTLTSDVQQLAGEILEEHALYPYYASLIIRFYTTVTNPELEQPLIEKKLKKVWGLFNHCSVKFVYSFENYKERKFDATIILPPIKITEEFIDVMDEILHNIVQTMTYFEQKS